MRLLTEAKDSHGDPATRVTCGYESYGVGTGNHTQGPSKQS